ncbi:alanine racemase, putative [Bodo saltans]|uniref:Alanine racemase, putative n=1 Tax=Bodo saltans TaxID=75058 RepID=A0A0S4IWQ0_BODSA|nr:alanine racemase, putative [Bodo saltans]|eukprot:CUG06411.1 alanine racemase, putative [Bodo saltans]
MVKGNAYGHGINEISDFLTKDLGQRRLGVASLGEALEIMKTNKTMQRSAVKSRQVAIRSPDKAAPADIVVFSDTELSNPAVRVAYEKHGNALVPVVGTMPNLKVFLGTPELRRRPLFLKLNTGMNRLGLSPKEVQDAIPMLHQAGVTKIQHLAQHFACSGNKITPGDRTTSQLAKFYDAVREFRGAGIEVHETSVSNSGAIEQRIGVNETYVRPGLMMYGPGSVLVPKRLWKGKQVGHFMCNVIHTMFVQAGDFVGYGMNAVEDACVIALLSVGYADGFLRYYKGLTINVNGIQGHVHGNVNMDLTAIAFPLSKLGMSKEAVEKRVKVGHPVLLWSDNIQEQADAARTITYELMTSLSIRIPRVYVK